MCIRDSFLSGSFTPGCHLVFFFFSRLSQRRGGGMRQGVCFHLLLRDCTATAYRMCSYSSGLRSARYPLHFSAKGTPSGHASSNPARREAPIGGPPWGAPWGGRRTPLLTSC